MQVTIEKGDIREVEADVVVVGALEGEGCAGGAVADLDAALEGEIEEAIVAKEFSGKLGTALGLRSRGRVKARRVVVVGLGRKEALTTERVRQAVGKGVRRAVRARASSMALVLVGAGYGELPVSEVAQAVAEAAHLAAYRFDTWKKRDADAVVLERVVVVEKMHGKLKRAQDGAALGTLMAEGAIEARTLVNEPAQEMLPRTLKVRAERIAKMSPSVSVEVFNREQAKQLGMTAFLAVAQGADSEPYFLHLRYTPKGGAKKSIALVGKGITYDSGGLSLKPSDSMKTMKMDMAGAASVLGVFSVIERLAPRVEVYGLIAACENMPSGKAYRPGDIVRAKNGLSIEVDNTDAEGRVTLADSLSYAVELKPDAIVDMATLTGACTVALGEEIVGVMTNNDALCERVFEAAEKSGEELWELPLFAGYDKLIDSKVADVKNVGNKWGGALTAGLFLQRFVGETPWVHLDIAGPAYAERDYLSYVPFGGTGVPVRTLLELLRAYR